MTTTNSNFRVKNALQLSSGALINNTVTDRVSVSGTLDVNTASIKDLKFPTNGSIQSLYEGGVQFDVGTDGSTSHTWTLNPAGTTSFPHYTFPADDGSDQQYLSTDGAGNLGWTTPTVNFTRIVASDTTTTNTSTGLILISDNGGRAAYYNTTASTWKYVGSDVTVYTSSGGFSPLDISGCVGWYDLTSFTGSTWNDKSGNGNHATVTGSPAITSVSGHGASITSAIVGGSSDYITWPSGILPSTYSLFYVDRRTESSSAGRILTNTSGGWLSGHWNNIAGTALHNDWVNQNSTDILGENWLLGADQNYFFQANGRASTLGTGGAGSYASPLTLNGKSDEHIGGWQAVEVIVYNTTLGSTNRDAVVSYLATKYGITLG